MQNPEPVSKPMATQEFYIRNASETEAHGPFTQEQLVSLAEAGKVDPQTLYYEAGSEQWVTIGANADLKAVIFPEKRRLTIKPKDRIDSVNVAADMAPPLSVDDMLAAAEGRTAETKSKRDKNIAFERAAAIGRYACIAMLFLSMAGLLMPSIEQLVSFDMMYLVSQPLVYFGLVDLFLMFVLLLGAVSTYPVIRFRCALGVGFLGIIFWCQGQIVPVITLSAGAIGLYLSTIFVSYIALALASGIGLAGMLAFAYYMVT
ncbi:MAG: DUF4339 domain-containing protein [Verrucomicrobia bacterium]|nr:DUF4339 domain-containing protein [Verrucomicrobiota bacterium]